LIPTIQSRCQKIYFKNLSISDLREYSVTHLNDNLTDEIIDLSSGSLSKLLNNTNQNKAEQFKKLLNYFYNNEISSIEKVLSSLNKIKMNDKNEFKDYLNFIKISAKDLYLLSSAINNNSISYNFLRDDYEIIIKSFPNANWSGIIQLIDDSILNFSRNINMSLEVYALMVNVRSCLQGKRVNRFHQQIGNEIK
tara:strand:- start:65 stop:646 length:582 start_codon:yes stop_codon:yes gene_type:complete